MGTNAIARPGADEYAPFYARYVARIAGTDPVAVLDRQKLDFDAAVGRLTDSRGAHRYAPGKWSVKELIGHLSDAERVFAYRAMRFARRDATELPGFDENAWVPEGRFDARDIGDLRAEWFAVREATVALARSLDAEAWGARGTANGAGMTVRALMYVIPGHVAHHLETLRERYGVPG